MQLCQFLGLGFTAGFTGTLCAMGKEIRMGGIKRTTRWHQGGTIYVTSCRSAELEGKLSLLTEELESARSESAQRLAQVWQRLTQRTMCLVSSVKASHFQNSLMGVPLLSPWDLSDVNCQPRGQKGVWIETYCYKSNAQWDLLLFL